MLRLNLSPFTSRAEPKSEANSRQNLVHSSYPPTLPFRTPSGPTSQLSEFHLGVGLAIASAGHCLPRTNQPSSSVQASISVHFGLAGPLQAHFIHGDTHESHRHGQNPSPRRNCRRGSMPPPGLATASAPQREALQQHRGRARRRTARLELPGRLRPDHAASSATTITAAAGAIKSVSIASFRRTRRKGPRSRPARRATASPSSRFRTARSSSPSRSLEVPHDDANHRGRDLAAGRDTGRNQGLHGQFLPPSQPIPGAGPRGYRQREADGGVLPAGGSPELNCGKEVPCDDASPPCAQVKPTDLRYSDALPRSPAACLGATSAR